MNVQPLNDHQLYFQELQKSIQRTLLAVEEYNRQELEYKAGVSDFQSSMSKMFQPLMAGMQGPITERIAVLKTKVMKLENDLKRFIEVDIRNYDDVKSKSFYEQYQQEYMLIQQELAPIMQEMSEKYPQDNEFITSHLEVIKKLFQQLANKLGVKFEPQLLQVALPSAPFLEIFLNTDHYHKFGPRATMIRPTFGKNADGKQFMIFNKQTYILIKEGEKYYFVRNDNRNRVELDEVFNNILIGNYDIIFESKHSPEEKRVSLEKYISFLRNAGIENQERNIHYINLCYDAFNKLEGNTGPKEIREIPDEEMRENERFVKEEEEKEKKKDIIRSLFKKRTGKGKVEDRIRPIIEEEEEKFEDAIQSPPLQRKGKGLPSDPISMFSLLYKLIAAKKAGHNGLDDNILELMKKLKKKKLITKEKQEELLKKIFVKNG